MSEVQCLKIRLKDGTTNRATAWLKSLKGRRGEAVEMLQAEGMRVESLFLERTSDGDYLYFYARADDLVRANEAFMFSTLPLSVETREITQSTWGEIEQLELVVDLDADR